MSQIVDDEYTYIPLPTSHVFAGLKLLIGHGFLGNGIYTTLSGDVLVIYPFKCGIYYI